MKIRDLPKVTQLFSCGVWCWMIYSFLHIPSWVYGLGCIYDPFCSIYVESWSYSFLLVYRLNDIFLGGGLIISRYPISDLTWPTQPWMPTVSPKTGYKPFWPLTIQPPMLQHSCKKRPSPMPPHFLYSIWLFFSIAAHSLCNITWLLEEPWHRL